MNRIDIIEELINVLLKYDLAFDEMRGILSDAKTAIGDIQVPKQVLYKHRDGTISDKLKDNF